jgi:ribA/ribD-fused uncharacterized protein
MHIKNFKGQYRFLSNFYPSIVTLDKLEYPTVEHAYQAAKTENLKLREVIKNCETASVAKRLGYILKLRTDWETIKIFQMRNLLIQKFNIIELKEKLLQTKNINLIEGNYWHDNFWGNCTCQKCTHIAGQNNLGKLLMEIRTELIENELKHNLAGLSATN